VVYVYIGVNFQVNQSLGRTFNIGQNMLYGFCYLLPLDLWIFYLARILFLKGVAACFGNLLVPQGFLMGCNIVSKSGKDSLMFQNSFLIRIPYPS